MHPTRLILLALLLAAPPALAQTPARLAAAFGPVALRAPQAADFAAIASGSPIAPGSTIRTGSGTRAVLVLAGTQVALEEDTEATILPADGPALVLARGAIAVVLREVATLSLATPRGLAELEGPGRYLIEAGDALAPTRLVAASGLARLATEAGTIPLEPGQAGSIPPQGLARMAPAGPTPALLAWLSGEAPPARAAAPPPASVAVPVPVPVPVPTAPQVTVIEQGVVYPYPVYGGWIGRPVRPPLPPVPPPRPTPPPVQPGPGPSFPPGLMTVVPPRGGFSGR